MKSQRFAVSIVLILSLTATAMTRYLAQEQRSIAVGETTRQNKGNRSSLSGMNSYALALMLGGLRGPLVMLLWTSSESQKASKDLEDFDTKVEWIRMLQPEFDTVHMFEIWNKAYNVSAQMSNRANKYSTILDALDYAVTVDRERPDNINILSATASLYFDKLGNSNEKQYYRRRVRLESQTMTRITYGSSRDVEFGNVVHRLGIDETDITTTVNPQQHTISAELPGVAADAIKAIFGTSGVTYEIESIERKHRAAWRRTSLDPVLAADGTVLPSFLVPEAGHKVDDAYNGSDFQFLPKYQPYPYGAAPEAIAYSYYLRAQQLQFSGERHLQLGPVVLDSRPAIALQVWSQDEGERGRRAELRMFDKPVPIEPLEMELPSAGSGFADRPAATAALQEALYSYALKVRLCADAVEAFESHVKRFPDDINTDASHLDDLRAQGLLAQADHDYLAAVQVTGDARDKLIESAHQNYVRAAGGFILIIMKYFISDDVAKAAFPVGYTRQNIDQVPPSEYATIYGRLIKVLADPALPPDDAKSDREEYNQFIRRSAIRIHAIESMGGPATSQPSTQLTTQPATVP